MRSIGGLQPSEIKSTQNGPENADIVLRNDNVIIEIKTLMEDPRDKHEFHVKHTAMYQKWVAAGKVPAQRGSTITIKTSEIPVDCAREYLKSITVSVKTAVKKANNQIKATKLSLGMPDAAGLLVVCNTGNSLLRPDVLLHGLQRALGDRHSAINWLIYMTYNHPVQMDGMPYPGDIFSFPQRSGHTPMPRKLADRIHDAWMMYISSKRTIASLEGSSASFWGAKQLKPTGN